MVATSSSPPDRGVNYRIRLPQVWGGHILARLWPLPLLYPMAMAGASLPLPSLVRRLPDLATASSGDPREVASSSPRLYNGLFLSSMWRRQWRLPIPFPSPVQWPPDPTSSVSNSSDL
ncbi:hypothetical protein [Oryza sativa Japonica Group]|uniref:Uncharacterized protein n=3 Tax=Oryza TaxID=4527 RepID=Q657Z9_ORYSJ|nr:hypothetical protein [Oryza sativa Japonica Group]BAD44935.1 hypothetical protein [Oryza sativa Japonica Group]